MPERVRTRALSTPRACKTLDLLRRDRSIARCVLDRDHRKRRRAAPARLRSARGQHRPARGQRHHPAAQQRLQAPRADRAQGRPLHARRPEEHQRHVRQRPQDHRAAGGRARATRSTSATSSWRCRTRRSCMPCQRRSASGSRRSRWRACGRARPTRSPSRASARRVAATTPALRRGGPPPPPCATRRHDRPRRRARRCRRRATSTRRAGASEAPPPIPPPRAAGVARRDQPRRAPAAGQSTPRNRRCRRDDTAVPLDARRGARAASPRASRAYRRACRIPRAAGPATSPAVLAPSVRLQGALQTLMERLATHMNVTDPNERAFPSEHQRHARGADRRAGARRRDRPRPRSALPDAGRDQRSGRARAARPAAAESLGARGGRRRSVAHPRRPRRRTVAGVELLLVGAGGAGRAAPAVRARRHASSASAPIQEARLPDGSQVQVLLPPLSSHGPLISVRCPPRTATSPDGLVTEGVLSMRHARRCCARACSAGSTCWCVGPTTAGVSTLLVGARVAVPRPRAHRDAAGRAVARDRSTRTCCRSTCAARATAASASSCATRRACAPIGS